jgi:hypothetical protein
MSGRERSSDERSRIPVKVIAVKDIHGKPHMSAMIDLGYFFEPTQTYHSELEEFKRAYQEMVKVAKTVLHQIRRSRRNARTVLYWRLGKRLLDFVRSTESKFQFTNYRAAFERDLGLTDSYVGVILDFPRFYTEDEVDASIPMSHYFELLLKARRLDERGRLGVAKQELSAFAAARKLPDHKLLRVRFDEMLSGEGRA